MTTDSPPAGETSNPGLGAAPARRRRTVDAGVATIVAACILAVGGVVGVLIGRATASGTPSAPTKPQATHATTIVSITPPTTGDIPFESTLSGQVVNLQRGQLVWTFFQVVNPDGSLGAQTYPDPGPCIVNYVSQTWSCRKAYIGKPTDTQTYRVCAAILDFADAFKVVRVLENMYSKNAGTNTSFQYWFTSPPSYIHHNPTACMSVHRIN